MSESEHVDSNRGAIFVLLLVCTPLLVFVPLLLSLVEQLTLGTNHVYEFCDNIGIADFLGEYIYRPVFRLFQGLF